MKPRPLFVLLILALACGVLLALSLRMSPQRKSPPVLPQEPEPSALTAPENPHGGSGSISRPQLPDMTGLAVGTGHVGVDLPSHEDGVARMSQELETPAGDSRAEVSWPRTSGKVRELEEQLRDIRDDVNDATLEAVSRTLNALPFVSAEPEEAEWHVSGGRIELEIRIPAEDIKIGNP